MLMEDRSAPRHLPSSFVVVTSAVLEIFAALGRAAPRTAVALNHSEALAFGSRLEDEYKLWEELRENLGQQTENSKFSRPQDSSCQHRIKDLQKYGALSKEENQDTFKSNKEAIDARNNSEVSGTLSSGSSFIFSDGDTGSKGFQNPDFENHGGRAVAPEKYSHATTNSHHSRRLQNLITLMETLFVSNETMFLVIAACEALDVRFLRELAFAIEARQKEHGLGKSVEKSERCLVKPCEVQSTPMPNVQKDYEIYHQDGVASLSALLYLFALLIVPAVLWVHISRVASQGNTFTNAGSPEQQHTDVQIFFFALISTKKPTTASSFFFGNNARQGERDSRTHLSENPNDGAEGNIPRNSNENATISNAQNAFCGLPSPCNRMYPKERVKQDSKLCRSLTTKGILENNDNDAVNADFRKDENYHVANSLAPWAERSKCVGPPQDSVATAIGVFVDDTLSNHSISVTGFQEEQKVKMLRTCVRLGNEPSGKGGPLLSLTEIPKVPHRVRISQTLPRQTTLLKEPNSLPKTTVLMRHRGRTDALDNFRADQPLKVCLIGDRWISWLILEAITFMHESLQILPSSLECFQAAGMPTLQCSLLPSLSVCRDGSTHRSSDNAFFQRLSVSAALRDNNDAQSKYITARAMIISVLLWHALLIRTVEPNEPFRRLVVEEQQLEAFARPMQVQTSEDTLIAIGSVLCSMKNILKSSSVASAALNKTVVQLKELHQKAPKIQTGSSRWTVTLSELVADLVSLGGDLEIATKATLSRTYLRAEMSLMPRACLFLLSRLSLDQIHM